MTGTSTRTVTVSSQVSQRRRRSGESPNFGRARTVLYSARISVETTQAHPGWATIQRSTASGVLFLRAADTKTLVSMTTFTGWSLRQRLLRQPPHP